MKQNLSVMSITGIDDVLIFNTRAKNDSLRNENYQKNFFHIPPNYSILADALTQYLVKKKWKKWFLVTGPTKNDQLYANALKSSAKKFNIKIKERKKWDFTSDLRRTAGKSSNFY